MRPYSRIMVGLDNSPDSQAAGEWALALAKQNGATLTALHVYNARQHELAFRRMEVSLPREHQDSDALANQRGAHQTLIEESLALIAGSYLAGIGNRCREEAVPFQPKVIEGKHYLVICEEAKNHDLVCLGAHGLGWLPGGVIGSVCERVLRRSRVDLLIARVKGGETRGATALPGNMLPPRGIAVAVDGSVTSQGAVGRAAWLASAFGASLESIHVFDPFFHRTAFGRMKGVLSAEAECLFKTGEQETLHDTVIDRGLGEVGEKHLVAARLAAKPWTEQIKMTLLRGKPFLRISEHLRGSRADLLVVGRLGSHFCPESDIGSTAENLARVAPCSVLVVNPLAGEEQRRQ